jgi:hypothetical protein
MRHGPVAGAQHHPKTFRAEALAQLQRAVIADCGSAGGWWRSIISHLRQQGGLARMWASSFEREAQASPCSGASATC